MSAGKKGKHLAWALFGAAGLLMGAGVAGSSRAALTYYNENYQADLEMSPPIGVKVTAREDPGPEPFRDGDKALPVYGGAENLVPGQSYPVEIGVGNTGEIEAYVRVVLRFYWQDDAGKRQDLDPGLIHRTVGEGWLEDTEAATREQAVYYCRTPLAPGENRLLVEELSIDAETAAHVSWNEEGTATSCDYGGLKLVVEAEADAVQTHNAAAAMESVWGREVTLEDGRITDLK